MRNLRKLTAAVLAIALVLTSMTATFAAETATTTATTVKVVNADKAATLKSLDLYAGKDATDPKIGLEDALTTEQSLMFLAKLFSYRADADKLTADEVTKALAKFVDAKDVGADFKNVVAYSAIKGIIKGSVSKDGKKFFISPKTTVTAARFGTFLLIQMGYDVKLFTESIAQISEVKGSKVAVVTGDLTRDTAVGIMYGALTAEKASGKTVIADIVGTDAAKLAIATKAGLFVTAGDLDVASVSATNLRELVVTYNKAPNAAEAKKAANYSIKSSSTVTAVPENVSVSEDGKTVTLRTTSGNKMSNYSSDIELTINKLVGFAAEKVIKGISVKDTTVPSVVSIKTTGPRNIKVTLSEPLDEKAAETKIYSAFKIDGGVMSFASVTVGGLEVNLKTYSDLTEGSHKLEVVSPSTLVDNAGYPLQVSTTAFDYVKDTSPLTFAVVESSETTVTINFNKALKAGTFGKNLDTTGNKNVEVSHTYADLKKRTGEKDITTSDDQKFVIDFGSENPFPPSATTVYIKYASDTGTKIEDNYGNKLAATTFTVNTTADVTKPTATAEFVSADTVKVTYSEDVKAGTGDNGANNKSYYELKSGTDTKFIVSANFDTDSKKVVLLKTKTDELNGTTYTVKIKSVKDTSVAANQIDEVTLSFSGTDKVAPYIKSAGLASKDKFKINFSEAMDLASIQDRSAYQFDGKPLDDKDTVVAADNNKAVVITFVKQVPVKGAKYMLIVGRFKDATGNWSKDYQKVYEITGEAVDSIALNEYQLVSTTGIKIVVEDSLQLMTYADFEYSIDGGKNFVAAKSGKDASVVDGKSYFTIVTEDLGYNTTGGGIEIRTVANVSAKNAFDSRLAFNTLATTGAGIKINKIIDKCPAKIKSDSKNFVPTFDTQKANKDNADTLKWVKLTYSEDIYASSVTDTDYTVAGYEVSSVVVSGATVTIYVKNVDYGSFTNGTAIKVKQVSDVEDLERNILGSQDELSFSAVK